MADITALGNRETTDPYLLLSSTQNAPKYERGFWNAFGRGAKESLIGLIPGTDNNIWGQMYDAADIGPGLSDKLFGRELIDPGQAYMDYGVDTDQPISRETARKLQLEKLEASFRAVDSVAYKSIIPEFIAEVGGSILGSLVGATSIRMLSKIPSIANQLKKVGMTSKMMSATLETAAFGMPLEWIKAPNFFMSADAIENAVIRNMAEVGIEIAAFGGVRSALQNMNYVTYDEEVLSSTLTTGLAGAAIAGIVSAKKPLTVERSALGQEIQTRLDGSRFYKSIDDIKQRRENLQNRLDKRNEKIATRNEKIRQDAIKKLWDEYLTYDAPPNLIDAEALKSTGVRRTGLNLDLYAEAVNMKQVETEAMLKQQAETRIRDAHGEKFEKLMDVERIYSDAIENKLNARDTLIKMSDEYITHIMELETRKRAILADPNMSSAEKKASIATFSEELADNIKLQKELAKDITELDKDATALDKAWQKYYKELTSELNKMAKESQDILEKPISEIKVKAFPLRNLDDVILSNSGRRNKAALEVLMDSISYKTSDELLQEYYKLSLRQTKQGEASISNVSFVRGKENYGTTTEHMPLGKGIYDYNVENPTEIKVDLIKTITEAEKVAFDPTTEHMVLANARNYTLGNAAWDTTMNRNPERFFKPAITDSIYRESLLTYIQQYAKANNVELSPNINAKTTVLEMYDSLKGLPQDIKDGFQNLMDDYLSKKYGVTAIHDGKNIRHLNGVMDYAKLAKDFARVMSTPIDMEGAINKHMLNIDNSIFDMSFQKEVFDSELFKNASTKPKDFGPKNSNTKIREAYTSLDDTVMANKSTMNSINNFLDGDAGRIKKANDRDIAIKKGADIAAAEGKKGKITAKKRLAYEINKTNDGKKIIQEAYSLKEIRDEILAYNSEGAFNKDLDRVDALLELGIESVTSHSDLYENSIDGLIKAGLDRLESNIKFAEKLKTEIDTIDEAFKAYLFCKRA